MKRSSTHPHGLKPFAMGLLLGAAACGNGGMTGAPDLSMHHGDMSMKKGDMTQVPMPDLTKPKIGDGGLPEGAPNYAPVCSPDKFCWDIPLPSGNTLNNVNGSSDGDVWIVGNAGFAQHLLVTPP